MADPQDPASLPTQPWAGPQEPSPPPATPGVSPPPSSRGSGWQPPEPEQLQPSFPQYEIRGVLGSGGMGAVYQGWQKSLRRLVAIKILPPQLEDKDANFAERFQREAQAMARFSHPGIVAVHDAGRTPEGLLYFVMEYIEGTDVQKMVREQGRLPAESALAITAHVCDALAYAHKRGVIHRDIKPANIMVDAEGQVKVADFGLAKVASDDSAALLTGSHVRMGTPDFMAPESMMGMGNTDHRADLYAVGVMLYQMLTGELPRGRFDPPSRRVPGLDVRFDAIVDHALQPDPEKRYSSAVEIRTDLDQILTLPVPHRSAVQQPPPPPSPPPAAEVTRAVPLEAVQKPKGLLYVGLVAGVLVLVAVAFFLVPKLQLGHALGPGSSASSAPSREAGASPTEAFPSQSLGRRGEVGADRASPSSATEAAPFVNTLGMKFVPVPILGGPTGRQRVLFSVWDTRVQDFEAFVKETNREWPTPDFEQDPTHPAVMVSWDDGQAFCAWLTERERKAGKLGASEVYRLPTDYEWSCAVGIGDREDPANLPSENNTKIHGVFPWGTQWPPSEKAGNYADEAFHAKFPLKKNEKDSKTESQRIEGYNADNQWIEGYNDGYANTSPVGSYAANRFGLYDMGGNVWQWCEDWVNKDQKDRVLRGGAWHEYYRTYLLSSNRNSHLPAVRSDYYGFRCVLAPVNASPAPIATVATATKDAPFENTLGMKFVPVPILGGPTGGQRVLFSVWDTRVQDYEEFVKETKRNWPKVDFEQDPTHPAVQVSWEDAQLFCQWLTAREQAAGRLPEGRSYRLPSDHEWSCAMGLGGEDAAKLPVEKNCQIIDTFPWGTQWPPPERAGNYASEELKPLLAAGKHISVKDVIPGYHDGYATTSPVGSYAANRFGLFDMGGNVQQWCQDWNDKDQKDRVLRGASWLSYFRGSLLSSNRYHIVPTGRGGTYGFRCVLAESLPPAAKAPLQAVSATPAAATKEAPFENTLGMKFVPVPETKVLFSIWDTRVQDYAAYARANQVDGSWQEAHLDGVPVSRESDDPVAGVSWDDAKAFCKWLTEHETAEGKLSNGARYRLPTDEEWSKAVGLASEQGTTPTEKSGKNSVDFPWGLGFPPKAQVGNYADTAWHEKFPNEKHWIEGYTDGYATASPVGSFAANRLGLYDMGGNVWQWCEDWFDKDQKGRVLRGASWPDSVRSVLLSSCRMPCAPADRNFNDGFRCVLEPAPPEAALATPAPAPVPEPLIKSTPASATPTVSATPKPATAMEKWFAEVDGPHEEVFQKQVIKPFEAGVADLRARYLASLDAAIARASTAGQLAEALAWRTERQAFEKAQNVAADDAATPPGVQALRAVFRQQLAKLDQERMAQAKALFAPYDAILAKNQTLLTQHQRLDDALLLQTKRDEIATAWLGPSSIIAVDAASSEETVKPAPSLPTTNQGAPGESALSSAATKDAPFVNTLGMKFVPVAIVGGPTHGQRVLFSIWDTRVQDYEVFTEETQREWPKPDFEQGPTHPVVMVSWNDATAFCAWLTERERKTGKLAANELYRLPGDHEWSRVMGLPPEQGATPAEQSGKDQEDFPWGRDYPPKKRVGNYRDTTFHEKFPNEKDWIAGYTDGYANTSPVGSFTANRFGLFDMGGDVLQWCDDWFGKDQKERVLRGSSWANSDRGYLWSSNRRHYVPESRLNDGGFRCVLATLAAKSEASAGASGSPTGREEAASNHAAAATKESPFVNTFGMKFVPVPIAGGSTDGQQLLVSVWKTRVQDYEVFAGETKREWPKPDFEQGPTHPAVMLSWQDAQAYCAWLTERERKAGKLGANEVYRLPSDHEWSCAVGIGAREHAEMLPTEKSEKISDAFPWGFQWPPPKGAGNYDPSLQVDKYPYTSPVGSFSMNRFGLRDLGGNAWEWCEDLFDKNGDDRVLRGAAWCYGDRGHLLSSYRLHRVPSGRYYDYGFRCVLGVSAR